MNNFHIAVWFQITIRCSLMSYPRHLLAGESNPSAEVQSAYSTALADWAVPYFALHQIILHGETS